MNIAGDERMCGKHLSPASESGRFMEMGYEKFLLLPPPPVSCAPPRLPAPDPPLASYIFSKFIGHSLQYAYMHFKCRSFIDRDQICSVKQERYKRTISVKSETLFPTKCTVGRLTCMQFLFYASGISAPPKAEQTESSNCNRFH